MRALAGDGLVVDAGAAQVPFGQALTLGVMVPISLLAMSIMSTSMYFTYRDSFVADTEELPPTEDTPNGEDR